MTGDALSHLLLAAARQDYTPLPNLWTRQQRPLSVAYTDGNS